MKATKHVNNANRLPPKLNSGTTVSVFCGLHPPESPVLGQTVGVGDGIKVGDTEGAEENVLKL